MKDKKDYTEASLKEAFVNNGLQNIPIFFYDETDSTNTRAKNCPTNDKISIFVADRQTNGRGRMGRSFESEGGVGIYASLLISGSYAPDDAVLFTVRAAVAICRAVRSLTGVDARIKWVNDITVHGSKLSGILTEGVFSPSGNIEKIIIGFGINVSKRKFSKEIQKIATSLEDVTDNIPSRSLLLAKIVREILDMPDFSEVIKEYRSLSSVIGRRITVYNGDKSYPATVLSITDTARLSIERDDGAREELFCGEVSIKQSHEKE